MANSAVHINFNKISERFRQYVREEAIAAGGKIVYVHNGQLVEEDPQTREIRIIRKLPFHK